MFIKLIVMFAALSGGVSVLLGAFAAHGLRGRLEERLLESFQTGVHYQLIHSLALLLVAILVHQWGRSAAFELSAYSFILGIVFFSGSLYGLALTEIRWLGPVTPLGGLAFIIGWVSLAVGGYLRIG